MGRLLQFVADCGQGRECYERAYLEIPNCRQNSLGAFESCPQADQLFYVRRCRFDALGGNRSAHGCGQRSGDALSMPTDETLEIGHEDALIVSRSLAPALDGLT